MTNKLKIDDIYDQMITFILLCGIQKKSVTRVKNSNSEESIVIECHDLLMIIMYSDIE